MERKENLSKPETEIPSASQTRLGEPADAASDGSGCVFGGEVEPSRREVSGASGP